MIQVLDWTKNGDKLIAGMHRLAKFVDGDLSEFHDNFSGGYILTSNGRPIASLEMGCEVTRKLVTITLY